ncbi:tyrosine-type recombinase/integrase [Basilea psittacipulmonis]|uniref:Tyr recombinase domain-containing protein n=1 Tax=Basilea psittacipulmonis DSM 24701 TaxID=1072685 RepID=A0A077DE45_9BURK|nr:site-specific integrase [Basilea psittacipulmonis]AIL33120.1 hypothetical protein IX83_07235 [Basilea psittacipulmonis DSM 24701]
MARYEIQPSGNWRVRGKVRGTWYSKTLPTKRECKEWWEKLEERLSEQRGERSYGKTLLQALERYAREVSIKKRGCRNEQIRIRKLIRDFPRLVATPLEDINIHDGHEWKNKRLAQGIKSSTLLKEYGLLSGVFRYCISEWFWLKEHPWQFLKLPQAPAHRQRIVRDEEIAIMCNALGYQADKPPLTTKARVACAMLFSLETGMRSGEICDLKWCDIKGRVAYIRQAKTDAGVRDVPLSLKAMEILKQLEPVTGEYDLVFKLYSPTRDALFRTAREKAGLSGFTFHDLRATACTRLSKKFTQLQLMKVMGHSDPRMLNVYYRESAEEMLDRLDS